MIRVSIDSEHKTPLLQSASHPGGYTTGICITPNRCCRQSHTFTFNSVGISNTGVVRNTGFIIERICTLQNDGSAGGDNRVEVIDTVPVLQNQSLRKCRALIVTK